jgi:hypothetical protein
MSGASQPYLLNVTISQPLAKYNSSGDLLVNFTVRWEVGPTPPDSVQIYTEFGSDTALLDLGSLLAERPPDQSLVSVSLPGANRNPRLFVGVAPRTSGDDDSWDSFVTEGGFSVTYPAPPPTSGFPPPSVEVSSAVKTLTSNDQLEITVIATVNPVDQYQVIVNFDGDDLPQLNGNDPWFSIPSVPGGVYAVKAQQRGVNFDGDPWSRWCIPERVVAKQRVRSLRVFLSISNVLKPDVGVRQYADSENGSIRRTMGI